MPQIQRADADPERPPTDHICKTPGGIRRIGFFVLNDFPMVCLSTAIEVLRMANEVAESAEYFWRIITPNGRTTTSSDGATQARTVSYSSAGPLDLVLVCGSHDGEKLANEDSLRFLRQLARQKVALGGICWGTCVLLKAGLMNGYRCAFERRHLPQLRERYPAVHFTSTPFEIDRERFSCTCGSAAMALMLELVRNRLGSTTSVAVSNRLQIGSAGIHRQTAGDQLAPGVQNAIGSITDLMEANLDTPLSIAEIARRSGIPVRRMQRMFQYAFGSSPTAYYLQLRLQRARELILRSEMTITDISACCGFDSLSHFSKSYRAHYGRTPSSERSAF